MVVLSQHNVKDDDRYAKPKLVKTICDRCRWPITKCVCGARMKEHAIQVTVFEERDVRAAFEKLDAGEPLAALDHLRDMLAVTGEKREHRPPRRRL